MLHVQKSLRTWLEQRGSEKSTRKFSIILNIKRTFWWYVKVFHANFEGLQKPESSNRTWATFSLTWVRIRENPEQVSQANLVAPIFLFLRLNISRHWFSWLYLVPIVSGRLRHNMHFKRDASDYFGKIYTFWNFD